MLIDLEKHKDKIDQEVINSVLKYIDDAIKWNYYKVIQDMVKIALEPVLKDVVEQRLSHFSHSLTTQDAELLKALKIQKAIAQVERDENKKTEQHKPTDKLPAKEIK